MSRIVRSGIFSVVLSLALLSGTSVHAQGVKAPPAPLPTAIISAKKVFVANGGHENNPNVGGYSGGIDRTYNQFYSALRGWGRYELVSTPADCDLVFDIQFTDAMSGGRVVRGDTVGPVDEPKFRLAILDPKTHIVLWAFTEHVESAALQGNRDRNFDQALVNLVNDVQNLTAQTATTPGDKQ